MALDNFESLPAIINELQDGGLQISEVSDAPITLVLGTASRGVTGRKVPVVRLNESENDFGREGTLVKGMLEASAGGAENLFLMRIGAKSAILFGVGTDDQDLDPTSIETLLRDSSAADAYFVRYVSPQTLSPNATKGRLIIKNAVDQVVYDNNPEGSLIDTGEVVVTGDFTGGADIGDPQDSEDFVSFRDLAQDEVEVEGFAAGTATGGAEAFDLGHADTVPGSHVVYVDGDELLAADFEINFGAGTGGVDELSILASANLSGGEEITVDYLYDAEPLYNLRDGDDGLGMSRMELYEALDEAYMELENDDVDIVIPHDVYLDDKNFADGDSVVIVQDLSIEEGQRYPAAGAEGDALGLVYKEEYEGELLYFWDVDGDGEAEIYPSVGAASATTKVDGSALEASDFSEVNFAYQLANFAFSLSVHDNEVDAVIGASRGPKSYATKDIAKWIGKEPSKNTAGEVVANGSGLLGNKFMAGTLNRDAGFFATFSGKLPTGADFDANADVIRDRNGRKIDIGKYLSVTAMPLTFFNSVDETGFGYQANMASFYGGFFSALDAQSAPTNKRVRGVRAPFKINKTKLNQLTRSHYVSVKQKEQVLRITDAPLAARPGSDYTRLTTKRITKDAIDVVRLVGSPYIGEPNTAAARQALETGIVRELSALQEAGALQRFEVRVSATVAQQIRGDLTVELILVPAFELRKITVITSLAKQ